MEARDRIERRAAGATRVQIVPGGRSQQRLVNHLGGRLIPPPIRAVESGERSSALSATDPSLARSRLSHSAKFGAGDNVMKVARRGISRLTSSTTCLMRKWPKDTPASPRWQLEIE